MVPADVIEEKTQIRYKMWLFKIGGNPCHLTLLPTCDVYMLEIKGYKAIGEEIYNIGN